MSGKSGAASKGLLAVRERAFIGPFTRVYAAMPCEGARIAERLQ